MSYDIEEIRSTYKDLFEYSLDLVFVNTFDGKFIYANDLALSTLGYERKDIPHFSLSDIMDKDQLNKAYNALIELKKTGRQSSLMELRLRGKDRSTIYVEIYVIPLYKNGKIYATLGIARNITDLRAVRKDLKQSEEKYRFLFETTPFSVVLLNLNGIIVDCNPMTERLFGLNKIELIGRHFKNISVIHQKYLPELINLFQRMINGEELHRIDIQMYKKDGSLIWANLQSAVLNIGGKIFVQATFHDITERKEITQKLEESENLYRTLVKTSPDAVIVTDLRGKIIEVSQKTVELSGAKSIEELIGKNAFDLISPQDIPKMREDHQNALKEDTSIKAEYTIMKLDGTHYIGELNTSVLRNNDGTPKAFIGIMRDITEQKNAEKLLKESEEQYRDLYQNALACLWTVRIQDTKIIRANNVSTEFTGVKSLKELIDKYYVSDFFEPDVIKDIYKKLKISGEISGLETRFKDVMGNEKTLSVWAKIYFDKGIIEGAFIDITYLKIVQKALQESEENFRTITEQSFIGIIIIQNGVLVYVNETVSKIMGYSFQELKNWSTNDFFKKIHPDDIPIAAERFQRMQKDDMDAFSLYSYRVFSKSGKMKWIEVYSKIIHYQGKNAIMATIVDITNKKDAEEKLKESEEKYRHLFENSPNMIILLDSSGKIFDANTYFHNSFNYKEDEIIGKNFQQLERISLKNTSIYKEKFRDIFERGILEPFELQVEVKGDLLRWMSIQGSLIDIDGKKLLQVIFQDINERKVAEQKLKESEEKYRIITENANDLIAVINEKFRFEYINEDVHKRITGYSKEELIGKSPLNNFHPEDVKKTVKTWRNGVLSGEGMTEFRYKKKDGTWIWLEMRGNKFIDTDGEPKGIIISRDITERKITEQKLKESEQKYRHLFESSPYSIGILDLEGILIESNEATNKFLSARTKDELIGKNIREIFSSNEQDKPLLPKLTEYIKKVIHDKIREPLEIPIIRSNGDVMWISFNGSLINIGDKTFLQFLGQDITDRKRAEQDLKKSEEKYRLLFENSPNAIILANSKGIILDFNYVTEKLMGIKRDELIGKNYTKIDTPENVKIMKKRYEDHLKGILLKPIEYEVKRRDGSYLWVNFQNKIIKLDDEDISIAIIQDITKRKEAELLVKEELIKLKELDQIRKDLISRVSHELKTPLIPVISGTELLTTIYRDQVGEDAIEIINMIDKGGARLKELVEKLINVSRIEYNKFEVRKESFNLSEIIKRSANGMKFLVQQRKLKLKCEILDKLYLEMDELRIEEVITNLLSNAIKNTPPHGEINLNLRKEDRWAILTVSDTGVGLTEKEKNVLFTRFGKIERYEEGLEEIDVKGSGLGLYICKEIIQLHGGQIWAESEGRNKGSSFNVKLPI